MISRIYLALDEDEELSPLDLIPMPPAPSALDIITPADVWLPGEDTSQPAPLPDAPYRVEYERDWTWIHFPGKPDESTLATLRSFARWGRERRAWYVTRHMEESEIASNLNGATVPEPETQAPAQTITESDRARAWLSSLDWDNMPIDTTQTAEFFHYDVTVYRSEKFGYYLHTRSPQQKQHRHSYSLAAARGDRDAITAGFERFLKEREAKQAQADARRDAKRQARKEFINPYKVGDFLYSHWGYDQTNTEMYQVIEARDVSLNIRRVCLSTSATGYDSGTATPIRDHFTEPARWITLQIGADGSHSVPSPIYGNLYKYDGKPVYFSSGH